MLVAPLTTKFVAWKPVTGNPWNRLPFVAALQVMRTSHGQVHAGPGFGSKFNAAQPSVPIGTMFEVSVEPRTLAVVPLALNVITFVS